MNGTQNIREKSIIISAAATLSGKANLRGILPEDIQGNVTDDSHVFSRMIFAHSAVIFMKCHVKAPMKRTFNAPMGSGCLSKYIHIT